MPRIRQLALVLGLSLAAAVPLTLSGAPAAQASHTQLAMFEEDLHVQLDPDRTMAQLRQLGVGIVRVYVEWSAIAPNPLSFHKPRFDGANDAAYPAGAWTRYDNIVRAALKSHIKLDFLIAGGAPFWATGRGIPKAGKNRHFAWRPSAKLYGDFVHAVARRYHQSVHFWELYNEPNFGEDLGPQAVHRILVAPAAYRSIVDAGFAALGSAGAGRDTIVIGQLAARGNRDPGDFAQTKPQRFIRTLYCVSNSYQPLSPRAAAAVGCPTNAGASRAFSRQHPGLFRAAGFGIHPYPQDLPPTQDRSRDPDYGTFPMLPALERTIDRAQRAYGSHRRLNIYNNEYGYVTSPPASRTLFGKHSPPPASPATAALYLNWAEYLSWQDPRIATTMQYLLEDPNEHGPSHFFSGLESSRGRPKATLAAYRMPLFLPNPVGPHNRGMVVWGAVRAAHEFSGRQVAQVKFRRGSRGGFVTLARVTITDPRGYFEIRVKFPASGAVQVSWTFPGGSTVSSRVAPVTIR